MTVNQLVKEQHRQGEETEFYPTTEKIVNCVAKWIATKGGEVNSILDIGCGNGNFFDKLDKTDFFNSGNYGDKNYNSKLSKYYKKYGIEKSAILAEQLPEDVILLGSDFYTNTLIDKAVDCIFCNPPYSDFETWAEKIILEGNADKIVLIIPNRWQKNERIKSALEKRKYNAEVIGTFDFSDGERVARCTVDVIGICSKDYVLDGRSYNVKHTDPFDVWFDDTFKLNADKENDYYKEREKEEQKRQEIVESGDTAEMLVKFYNADMEQLYNNYRALEKLDTEIFKELKVDVAMLKKSLRERLRGLKNVYWDMLFKKYDRITSRLTTEGRRKVINRLEGNTAIDFTLENIFQLTLWIIRHSNTLFDEQLTDFFFTLAKRENIHRYKSNLRWNESDWKYLKDKCYQYGHYRKDEAKKHLKNVILDYRIIVSDYRNFAESWSDYTMTESCIDFLYDLKVIAGNLGFETDLQLPTKYEKINPSDWSNFDVMTTGGKLFCNIKLYKNGNRHIKFCKEFMQKFNVEVARICKWVHSKEEAKEELGFTEKEIAEFWNRNIKIGIGEGTKLLGLPQGE